MTMTFPHMATDPGHSLRPLIRTAAILCASTLGALVVWAAWVPLDSAVVGSGTVSVDGAIKAVQHPDGGVVDVIPVRDGGRVSAGDVVLQLDQTALKADLDRIEPAFPKWRVV